MTLETLIPMVDYIELLESAIPALGFPKVSESDRMFVQKSILFKRLLKEKLEIFMFVPAVFEDGKWVVLEKPDQYLGALEFAVGEDYENALKFQEAKANCYFEGFSMQWYNDEKTILDLIFNGDKFSYYWTTENEFLPGKNGMNDDEAKTIEDLVKYNLTLSENLKKRLL